MAINVVGQWTVPAGLDVALGIVKASGLAWGVPNRMVLEAVFDNIPSTHEINLVGRGRADFVTRIPGADRTVHGQHVTRDKGKREVRVEVEIMGFTRNWTGIVTCPIHDSNGKDNKTVFAKDCKLEVEALPEPTPEVADFGDAIVLTNPGRIDYSQVIELSATKDTTIRFVSERHYYEPASSLQGWEVVLYELGPKRHELDPYVLPQPTVENIGDGDGGMATFSPVLPMRDFEIRFFPTINGARGSTFYGRRGTTKPLLR